MITLKELAELYGISQPTMRKYLKELNIYDQRRRYISPYHLKIIFEKLGDPSIKPEHLQ